MFLLLALIVMVFTCVLAVKSPKAGVLLALVSTFLLVIFCLAFEDYLALPSALLILPLTMFLILAQRIAPDRENKIERLAKIILSITLFIFCCFMGIFMGYWGMFFLFALLLGIGKYLERSALATVTYIISTISSCVRQNLPLPPALLAAASGRTDNLALVLQKISSHIEKGKPLSQAIKKVWPRFPANAIATIKIAEGVDKLPSAFEILESELALCRDENKRNMNFLPFYFLILLLFIVSILWVFSKVINAASPLDFTNDIPLATKILFGLFEWPSLSILSVIIGLLFCTILISFGRPATRFTPISIQLLWKTKFGLGAQFLRNHTDLKRPIYWLKWHLPLIRSWEQDFSSLYVAETLRMSLEAGCTVDKSISNTFELDLNYYYQKQLRKWHDLVTQGQDVDSSALKAGLGSSFAWVFDLDLGKAPILLKTLESLYRNKINHRLNFLMSILWLSIYIAIGLLVGFIFCVVILGFGSYPLSIIGV